MLGHKPTTTTILLVATDDTRRTEVAQQLEALGYNVVALADQPTLEHVLRVSHYDLLMVDFSGDEAQPAQPLAAYVGELMAAGTPVLMLPAVHQPDAQAWTREVLNHRIGAALRKHHAADLLTERLARYEGLAILDPETALFSRRYLDAILPTELERARRTHQPLTLLLLAVDMPTPSSQAAWPALSARLLSSLRQTDMIVRFSDSRVLVLLPATESALARAVAARLLKALDGEVDDTAALPRLSIGMATFPQHGTAPEVILAAVQHSLSRAVQPGQIVSFEQA